MITQSILSSVVLVLPQAEHRHCARHIFSHWHKKYKGDDFKYMFWSCAKSYNEADFNRNLEQLHRACPDGAVDFNNYNPKLFCRSYLGTTCKSDVITSNMVETFNNYIINARMKHILYMLEDIRASIMQRLVKKREEMGKWKTKLCPRIQAKLEVEKAEACKCDVLPSTATLFQVQYYLDNLVVDLEAHSCTCRKWDALGIPCCHACAAIFFKHKQPEDYVAPWYTIEVYARSYAYSVPPIEGETHWPPSNLNLDPPPIKIGPGRPRKNRIKDPHEDPKKPGSLTRHGMEMTCSICGIKGHNKRRCHNRSNSEAPSQQPPAKRGRGRPRKEIGTSQPRISQASSSHHDTLAQPSRLGRGGRVVQNSRGGSRGRGRSRGRGNNSIPGSRSGPREVTEGPSQSSVTMNFSQESIDLHLP